MSQKFLPFTTITKRFPFNNNETPDRSSSFNGGP